MALDIEVITKRWKHAQDMLMPWRSDAREEYDFAAVRQWREEDLARLEEEERPALTFDRVGVFIEAVCGMETNNRQAIKYFPVEQGDVHTDDILTQAAKYFEDDCGAPDEDSESARDALICGVGITETVMDYEKNQDGAPIVLRRDPLMFWWDPGASRRNLKDAKYVFYGHWTDEGDAKQRWPDSIFSGESPYSVSAPHRADRAFLYKDNQVSDDLHKDQVFILQYQCYERIFNYRMQDPTTGEIVVLDDEQLKAAKKLYQEQFGRSPREGKDYIKQYARKYYKAFLSGDEILEESEVPISDFTFQAITYKRDRNRGCWYGMMRAMKDPARWANKWLSQVLHIMNTNAKGGAFAETAAFQDPREAERQWATANPLILLKEGGIDKIRERGQGQYPSGLDRLMMFAFNALPMTTGINLEVLGLADREQAGVLENQRRQSAYGILAPFFAAIREYRKSRGKLLLEFINNFIPDGTLVKITGQAGAQYVPLVRKATRYDVKVDQAPDSPDFKQKTWEALAQILPPMMKAGYPIPPEVINYSPLPPDVAEQWVAWIKQQGWMPPEQQQQIQQMQQMLQQLGDENQKLKEENLTMKVDSTIEMAKLQGKMSDSEARSAVKVYQTDMEATNRRIEDLLSAHADANSAKIEAVKALASARQNEIDGKMEIFQTLVKAHTEAQKNESKGGPQSINVYAGEKPLLDEIASTKNELEKAKDKKKPRKFKVVKQGEGSYQIEESGPPEAA